MFSIRSLVEVGKALMKFGLVRFGCRTGAVESEWSISRSVAGADPARDRTCIVDVWRGTAGDGRSTRADRRYRRPISAVAAPERSADDPPGAAGRVEGDGRVARNEGAGSRGTTGIRSPQNDAGCSRCERRDHESRTLRRCAALRGWPNRAPILVAKGADDVAAKIREIARESNVPIFEAPPLARTIFRNVDIGVEIPAELYVAVAQVLTYVLQLQAAMKTGIEPPPRPAIDPALKSSEAGGGADRWRRFWSTDLNRTSAAC